MKRGPVLFGDWGVFVAARVFTVFVRACKKTYMSFIANNDFWSFVRLVGDDFKLTKTSANRLTRDQYLHIYNKLFIYACQNYGFDE